MYTLIVDYKVIKDVDYIDDKENHIVTFILPNKHTKYEKKLLEDAIKYYDSLMFDKLVSNYHNTYRIDDKEYTKCFPLEIKTNKGKAELKMFYSSEKDIEKYLEQYKSKLNRR